MLQVQGTSVAAFQYAVAQEMSFKGERFRGRKGRLRDAVTAAMYRAMQSNVYFASCPAVMTHREWVELSVRSDPAVQEALKMPFGMGWLAILIGLMPIIEAVIRLLWDYFQGNESALAAIRENQ